MIAVVVLGACTTVVESTGPAVERVIDGDTLVAAGLSVSSERIRLVGINAPEAGECLADAATERLSSLTASGELHFVSDRENRDRFGRLLRYLYVDGVLVNTIMLQEGLATRLSVAGIRLEDDFHAAQAQAQAASAGIWASDACGPSAAGSLEITGMQFDAPGDDTVRLNEEWVQFTNNLEGYIDLTGWAVRDESSTNRFFFPRGFTLLADESVMLRSGCGDPTRSELFWCSDAAGVWNNSGDTVMVLDASGSVVAYETYSP